MSPEIGGRGPRRREQEPRLQARAHPAGGSQHIRSGQRGPTFVRHSIAHIAAACDGRPSAPGAGAGAPADELARPGGRPTYAEPRGPRPGYSQYEGREAPGEAEQASEQDLFGWVTEERGVRLSIFLSYLRTWRSL